MNGSRSWMSLGVGILVLWSASAMVRAYTTGDDYYPKNTPYGEIIYQNFVKNVQFDNKTYQVKLLVSRPSWVPVTVNTKMTYTTPRGSYHPWVWDPNGPCSLVYELRGPDGKVLVSAKTDTPQIDIVDKFAEGDKMIQANIYLKGKNYQGREVNITIQATHVGPGSVDTYGQPNVDMLNLFHTNSDQGVKGATSWVLNIKSTKTGKGIIKTKLPASVLIDP